MPIKLGYCGNLQGELNMPGDKSISHRSIIFSALSPGVSRIEGFLESNDCIKTIDAFRKMGVKIIRKSKGSFLVQGVGLEGLCEPKDIIDCGNSGTTMRLLSGLLTGQSFYSVLSGDNSLNNRPMKRIIIPLTQIGGTIWSRSGNFAPLSIKGTGANLKGIRYNMPIASAQLKSSILLAGLYTDENITLIEPAISRDHTEKLFEYMGLRLIKKEGKIHFPGNQLKSLDNRDFKIPGDISAASFFIAAALMVEDSDILIKNVGINHSRSGFLEIVKQMGGNIELINRRTYGLEPVADIRVKHSSLQGVQIDGDIIPRLIDELPLLAVLGSQAKGQTIIRDAAELRVKETDRIEAMVDQLSRLGVNIKELDDGMIINGPNSFNNNLNLRRYGDHRIAMSLAIACLKIKGKNNLIENTECINNSFPDFEKKLTRLIDK